MPNYKRFDISFKHKGKFMKNKKSEFTLAVINLFLNKNAQGVYVNNNKLYMTSIYRVIPSFNYKIYLTKNIEND